MTQQSDFSTDDIVPILSLSDPLGGIAMLETVFGFQRDKAGSDDGILVTLGDQKILVVSGRSSIGPVRPHHVALSVPDVDVAMRDCQARGGKLATSMTPDGPLEIPEFWTRGVRYVFFDGPEGALIEFCAKKDQPNVSSWGQDHIGFQCDDLQDAHATFVELGCIIVAAHTLQRPEGVTDAVFLKRGNSVVELFSPPKIPADTKNSSSGGWVGYVS